MSSENVATAKSKSFDGTIASLLDHPYVIRNGEHDYTCHHPFDPGDIDLFLESLQETTLSDLLADAVDFVRYTESDCCKHHLFRNALQRVLEHRFVEYLADNDDPFGTLADQILSKLGGKPPERQNNAKP